MLVESLRLVNFKKFKDQTFDFNDDVNIFVGDNNAGKSHYLLGQKLCASLLGPIVRHKGILDKLIKAYSCD